MLFAEGFESALVGFVEGWHPNGEKFVLALYDRQKCIESLAEDMTISEAEEFFEFNVAGAYAGPGTPCFANFAKEG